MIGNHTPQTNTSKSDTELATQPQVNLIKQKIAISHLLTKGEAKKISDYLENGMTKTKASEIISWWLGDSKNKVAGERAKREAKEKKAKHKATKAGKLKVAQDIVDGKLEVKDEDAPFPDETISPDDMPE